MSTLLKASTKEQQTLLASYCRTGELRQLEGTTDGRLHHYRRLVFNVVKDALSSTYPLTVNLLTQNEWEKLCKRFFADHKCQHHQVWRMPFELIDYVEKTQFSLSRKYPFLLELLLFEWKEVEYYMMENEVFPSTKTEDWKHSTWVLNPESEILPMEFPLHKSNARFVSITDRGQYFCLIFRQPETYKVKFIDLSPYFVWLLESIANSDKTIAELTPEIHTHFGLSTDQEIESVTLPFFEKMKELGFIL